MTSRYQEIGDDGERKAKELFYGLNIDIAFEGDRLFKVGDRWYLLEVKYKERFQPPPFWGHGLDKIGADLRLQFYQDTGIRPLFLVFDPDGDYYWQWLDVLVNGEYFTTRNGILIFPIHKFEKNNLDLIFKS